MKTREYQYDNIRFLLMALAVLGTCWRSRGNFLTESSSMP